MRTSGNFEVGTPDIQGQRFKIVKGLSETPVLPKKILMSPKHPPPCFKHEGGTLWRH